jgi:hypothetical protein
MRNTLILTSLVCLASSVASAGVIFSTDGTASPSFFPLNGASSTSAVYHAFQFTVGAGQGGTFDQLVTGVKASGTFSATFSIFNDSAGSIGSLIDGVTIPLIDGVSQLYTGNATNHVTLASGSTYWLAADLTTGGNSLLWLQDSSLPTAREFSSASGYFNGQPATAFALLQNDPASVPEPGTWTLCFCALALFPAKRLLRR